jgi:putative ABC transport system ATP-binding protein
VRVAIAEDGVLLREGLARLLGEAGFEVVAQCGDADELLLKVRGNSLDAVIVDIRLPPTHSDEGLRAAIEIRERHPSIGVLVLSQYVELGLAMKLLADSAEGVGYLLKDRVSDVEDFVSAVRRVADGGSAIDPIIVSTLLSRQRNDDPLELLTPREREVPTDRIDAPAAAGASHGDKELKMEAITMPAAQADGRPLADTANGSVVAAHELNRRYGEGETAVDALRGVSLQVAPGKLTAVMGPSGSGKSTLMHILAGLDQPTSGEVTIAGTSIGELNDTDLTKLRREHIGFIFQFFNLLPMLTAQENVVLPLSLAGEKPDREWVDELMKKIGLGERSSHRPSELSGGQQQRVAIGRALVSKPTIVFADEPTGNLDSKTSGEILDLMRDSVETYGQTTVMVTHDPGAAAIADRVLFLADGVIARDLGSSDAHEVLAVMEELAR